MITCNRTMIENDHSEVLVTNCIISAEDTERAATYRQAHQRQLQLLECLRSRLFVDVQILKEELGVSVATIRRDLADLENQGLLRRIHGGAVSINQVTHDNAVAVREMTNVDEKRRIAVVAAAMISDGDTVMIDSGTTSLEVARELATKSSVTFVTNGSDVMSMLIASGVSSLHVIGGEYVEINHSFSGSMAADMVRCFNVDKVILSVTSVDITRGLISTSSPQIGCVQQAMIDVARSVIVVADYSKFTRAALSVIASLDRVDHIVTDEAARSIVAAAPEKLKKKFIFA